METDKVRVLVADDNDLFRMGVVSLLADCETIDVVGQARDGWQAVSKTQILRPDVVLMDLNMPRMDGVEATQRIRAEHPDVNVAMLTVSEEEADLFSAVRSGARSYLVKSIQPEALVEAILTTATGGSVITPWLAHKLLDEFAKIARSSESISKETEQLSPRQREVLVLVARGASNKEIAHELVIAENTVKVHLRNILEKLQIRNRQQAAALAAKEGLIDDVDEQRGYAGR